MSDEMQCYRIHTIDGGTFEVMAAMGCARFAWMLRADGYLQTAAFCIPYPSIAAIVNLSAMKEPMSTLVTMKPEGRA